MAAQTETCVSLKVVEVVVAGPAVESGDTSPAVQGSVIGACEEPLRPPRGILGAPREPWLPSSAGERFGFHLR